MAEPNATARGREVFAAAVAALSAVQGRLGAEFPRAVDLVAACAGRVVVTGIGKSGHVARKLAATLSSTGTPAVFLHAAEATHGDLGFLRSEDLCIMVSKSGAGEELLGWLPFLRERGCPLVAICGTPASPLARAAAVVLDTAVAEEACPLNLAPTTSSTAAMVMGDALALALLDRRGFGAEDFLRLHPSGVLGRRLSLRVADLMHQGEALPVVREDTSLREALLVIIRKGLGMTCILGREGALLGVLTDGDLKRLLVDSPGVAELLDQPVARIATRRPRCVGPELLAAEALRLMESNHPGPITSLVVTAPDGALLGVLHLHDILRAGLS
jgi:arabinose-5-phosphate isomerase